MKRILHLAAVSALALYITTATSCKPKDNDPVCKISSYVSTTPSSSALTTISYNSDGKISAVAETGSFTQNLTFTYSGNSIEVVEGLRGAIQSTDYVTLNSNGDISNVITKNSMGTVVETMSVAYDGAGHVQSTTSQSTGGSPDITNFSFSGGDMTTLINGSDVTNVTYYTDKNFIDGDYIKSFQMFSYGALYIKNMHLVKSFSGSGGTPTNVVYEFDADGKITKTITTDGTDISTDAFQYNCK